LIPLPLLRRGKVRDIYDLGDELLLVATDRISAFDCVLPQEIPGRGIILTQLSRFWFERTRHIVDDHLLSADADEIARRHPKLSDARAAWAERSMLVRRTTPFPIECVVRGYLAGSGWKEYVGTGRVSGVDLPPGLPEAAELPTPLFAPSTKATSGHDENIDMARVRRLVGLRLADWLQETSLKLYEAGRDYAYERGIVLADTKFEFGTSSSGEILLIDEVLTPDSSRFWDREAYEPGGTPPSFDKQPLRDYLEGLVQRGVWNRQPPPPMLPAEVIAATSERYREAYRRLVGEPPLVA